MNVFHGCSAGQHSLAEEPEGCCVVGGWEGERAGEQEVTSC